ncbi:unnamed protein product [Mytilus edulis]|uniref:C-type lectin domain-containing protein n=1 Tax=Mytilus edulis TaxID=6550 RepID=A0A8S3SAX8_MYTED|nr:unnamed protein product [Mytilus edulis]
MFIVHNVTSIPCLSDESKKDFNDSRSALKDMESNLKITAKKLENSFTKITASIGNQLVVVKTALTTVGKNVKKVDKLLQVLGKDFQKTKWKKFNGHCYYYGSDKQNWFMAESDHENNDHQSNVVHKFELLKANLNYSVISDEINTEINADEIVKAIRLLRNDIHYWLGLTDLNEGEYRWTFDQTKATYIPWDSHYGKKGTTHNCVSFTSYSGTWFDFYCNTKYYYICESNECF